MSKKEYYVIKTKEELTEVNYVEIFDSDSGSSKEQQIVTKDDQASYIC